MVPRTLFQGPTMAEKRSNTPRDVRGQERLRGYMTGFKDGRLESETGCAAWETFGSRIPRTAIITGDWVASPDTARATLQGILMFAFWRRRNEQKEQ